MSDDAFLMRNWPTIATILLLSSFATSHGARGDVDFAKEILPIFQKHCYECHGPNKQASGYRLDNRDIAQKGGDSGDIVIRPKDAKNSPLFRYVNGDEEGMFMPPKDSGKPSLSSNELRLLRTWIDDGAIWPDEFAGHQRQRSSHWSLQRLVKPTPPADHPNPLDAFIQRELMAKGIHRSVEADRRTLIRRLSFDLIGLPPSPSEVDAFVNDHSDQAYSNLVDRLLASPHYGERWARHWLDIARYTESQGFEYDRLRENAWHYRDYVIKSFNEDKPYNLFMKEQIAGDVMEPMTTDGIVATSLLVCGPWDQAGNSQKNQTQRSITREDELEDLIGVVGQSFLGLTINCARCHSHKFDPIPHEDYYRIKSVFEGVKHGERTIATKAEISTRENRQKNLQREIDLATTTLNNIESEGAKQTIAKRPVGSIAPGPTPYAKWTFSEDEASILPGELKGGALIKKSEPSRGSLHLPKEGAYFQTKPITKDIREKTLEAWVTLANLDQSGGAAISIESSNGQVFDAIVFGEQKPKEWISGSENFSRTKAFRAPEETSSPSTLIHVAIVYSSDNTIAFFRNGQPQGSPYQSSSPIPTFAAGDARILLGRRHTGGGKPWLLGEIQQASLYDRALTNEEVAQSYRAHGASVSKEEIIANLSPEQSATHSRALTELQRAKTSLSELAKLPVSYVGVRVQPATTKRLARGDVNSPEEEVTPSGLSAIVDLDPNFGLSADAPEKDRRLKFAEWLASDHNPLPARVMVNRTWHLHFGQGLVGTPNDFGVSGERPSHPELLDWLAVHFIENGWSMKALHRLIVQSETYRQSSAFQPSAAAIDADNRLLWRFAPRRLEAEAIRDAILSVSGQLNTKMGGPGFRPFTTTEFNATFYTPVDRAEPEFQRRTVYRINVNSGKDPLLDSFDCPDPSVKTPKRGATTTPLQALELMNNAFIQRQSNHLSERAIQSANGDFRNAIDFAYEFALSRKPNNEERQRALAAANERGLPSVCWALFNSTEFVYVR